MSSSPSAKEIAVRHPGMLKPLPPISCERAHQVFAARQPVKRSSVTGQTIASSSVVAGAPSIIEQARALKNDVDLIYEFVADNIDLIVNYGLHKGGLGALIDGAGNAFDQSDLMVQLLNASGYSATYVIGTILLTPTQWSNWLGVDQTQVDLAQTMVANGGIPVSIPQGTSNLQLPSVSMILETHTTQILV